jgi:hypothetical protein
MESLTSGLLKNLTKQPQTVLEMAAALLNDSCNAQNHQTSLAKSFHASPQPQRYCLLLATAPTNSANFSQCLGCGRFDPARIWEA